VTEVTLCTFRGPGIKPFLTIVDLVEFVGGFRDVEALAVPEIRIPTPCAVGILDMNVPGTNLEVVLVLYRGAGLGIMDAGHVVYCSSCLVNVVLVGDEESSASEFAAFEVSPDSSVECDCP
jgi:hypothetical protein